MFDPKARSAVRAGRGPSLASRLRRIFAHAARQARAKSSPFKLGDYLTGDDPFNGCKEGVVTVINGSSIGLRPTSSDGSVVFYDYRQLRKPW
ncbi:hypothetical protein AB6813_21210 [bacterium RCC_150]